jgi:hypothetical protein
LTFTKQIDGISTASCLKTGDTYIKNLDNQVSITLRS